METRVQQVNRSFDAQLWAAEELAIDLGWLRECPYHGQPYRAGAVGRHPHGEAQRPTAVSRELLQMAAQVTKRFGYACDICARERMIGS